jgi:hypothetical protein
MADIFHSPKLRVQNAKGHIANLQSRINIFLSTKPYARVVEPDATGINQLHKIKFTKPLPDEFATIAADVVDNLRSALDQAWYAVAMISKAIQPGGEAQFPFADNVTSFEKKILRGFKKFPNDILMLLGFFQPYKGGNDLLWALNRICVANKHKMLAPIGYITGTFQVSVSGGWLQSKGPVSFGPVWDRHKQELIYAKVGPGGYLEGDYNINFAFDIAFDEVEVVGGKPAIAVLRQSTTIVDRIIRTLEAETRRLGYI